MVITAQIYKLFNIYDKLVEQVNKVQEKLGLMTTSAQFVSLISQKLALLFGQLNQMYSCEVEKLIKIPKFEDKIRKKNKSSSEGEEKVIRKRDKIKNKRKKVASQKQEKVTEEKCGAQEGESKKEFPKAPSKPQKKTVPKALKELQNEIKRPVPPCSSYIYFFNDQRNLLTSQYPLLSISQLNKVAAKLWKQLTQQQKEVYTKKFNEAKSKYLAEMKEFKKKEVAAKKQQIKPDDNDESIL